jgi:prepilin-type N-terminal cleavage/methylation domain-containing protein
MNRMWPIGHILVPGRAPHGARAERGFTLLELLLVMSIAVTITVIAAATIGNTVKSSQADGGLSQVEAALQTARELSISERRNMELDFVGTDTVQIIRHEVPGPDTTMIRSIQLEGGFTYTLTSGVPDTPDAFGNGEAVSISSEATPPMFTTDGSLIDSNGDVTNATLFIGKPGDPLSARAVSIFGPTGALRLWSWNGQEWVEK